jgi:hypothetical protein
MLAVTVGVGVSAFVVGHAWDSNRRWLAAGLVLTVAVGESFNLMATAERLVAGREASQAPLRAGQVAHEAVAKRVAEARAADEKAKGATSRRLVKAEVAKAAADKAVVEKSAERGCVSNCAKLLQKAVDDAAAEVAAAREELAQDVRKAESDLHVAEAALGAVKSPPSATPLARSAGARAVDPRPAQLGHGEHRRERAGLPPDRLRRASGGARWSKSSSRCANPNRPRPHPASRREKSKPVVIGVALREPAMVVAGGGAA